MRLSSRFAILLVVSGAGVLPTATVQPVTPRAIPHADTAQGVVITNEYGWMESAGVALDPWIDA